MSKYNHAIWLRFGFGIFLLIWGINRIMRAKMWASPELMGQFYGKVGSMPIFIALLGIVQLLIALSFFTNFFVKYTSIILLVMFLVSTAVTIVPMFNYLLKGGSPVPAIFFADQFPLMAGTLTIFLHSKS
ncbi:MAG: hypothetical protein WAM28_04835 [Chlamydiales bacterium]